VSRVDRHLLGDFAARTFVGALFVLLCANLWADFRKTGHLTPLLFMVSEALVVVLTIVRRRTTIVDRSAWSVFVTTVSLVGPPLVRSVDGRALVPDVVTAGISLVGVAFTIFGKATIGRSFGIAPANRGVVAGGPYGLVRHPIYLGYVITHLAFLLAFPSLLNVGILVIADAALVLRALAEERVLSADRQYQEYCGRVAWHLVPGVF
jgi:protein-S-isoprenylcysteine O-methyltransferase Ste14